MKFSRLVVATVVILQVLASQAFAQSSMTLPVKKAAHISGREKNLILAERQRWRSKRAKQERMTAFVICYLTFPNPKRPLNRRCLTARWPSPQRRSLGSASANRNGESRVSLGLEG